MFLLPPILLPSSPHPIFLHHHHLLPKPSLHKPYQLPPSPPPHTPPPTHHGSAVLHDVRGQPLNLDGTPLHRAPNQQLTGKAPPFYPGNYVNVDTGSVEEDDPRIPYPHNGRNNRNWHVQHDQTRLQTVLKAPKLNVPEFEGEDADNWI